MKASQQQQEVLLELSQIDLLIRRNQIAVENLHKSSELDQARGQLLALSEELINARNVLDALRLDLKRAEQDLKLVEDRIATDNLRLEQSSSPKDIQGIQHELVSLNKRKDTLEEAELVLIEKVDEQANEVELITASRDEVQALMNRIENDQNTELAKLKSGAMLLIEDRARAISNIPKELAEHYEKLKARKVGVGRFSGIECGACGMTLTGANLDEIRATPMDELAHCGECGGILVR